MGRGCSKSNPTVTQEEKHIGFDVPIRERPVHTISLILYEFI